jgi:hypothetical protein
VVAGWLAQILPRQTYPLRDLLTSPWPAAMMWAGSCYGVTAVTKTLRLP